ncbi:MAG: aminoacyl-tRNA hydrolase [Solirubrobacterales bacterium]|nr:aminoacyl-tRNA hydrolase [Solirubrobacterales bacterium]MCB0859777.1 aminoacyl-tRNA hydrolase [Solirubrobacterales bacterium]HRV60145.1 alternative ribosome rescue aminoacyl-tRNA hydrolase ArfB [Solirubrobacterales bacterium]
MKPGIRPRGGPFIPVSEITLRASRSSGPGGQHANVTASRIEAVFEVRDSLALNDSQKARITRKLGSVVTAVSQDARSQTRNRDLALERLESKLAGALTVPRRRRPTKPTRASKQKRLESKRQRSETKRNRRPPRDDE